MYKTNCNFFILLSAIDLILMTSQFLFTLGCVEAYSKKRYICRDKTSSFVYLDMLWIYYNGNENK